MAEKARAALARSRLASERVAAAAERAARDADAETSRVREEWARQASQLSSRRRSSSSAS